MLKIYINNIEVVYDENISIQIELNSPVFTKKTAFSFPFKLPHSQNSEIFRSIADLGNLYQKKGNDCVIEHGNFRIGGKVYIEDVTDNYVNLNFRQEPVENFMQDLKNKYLNEIDYKEDFPSSSEYINYYNDPPDANGDYNYNYAFTPIDITSEKVLDYLEEHTPGGRPQSVIMNYRQKIYESESDDENYDILPRASVDFKNGYGSISEREQEDNYDSNELIYDIATSIMPFWRLNFVVEKIAEFLGLTIKDNDIKNTPLYNSMLIYSVHAMIFNSGPRDDEASFEYLPNITIIEFFNTLKEDLGILTVFNFVNRTISFLQKKNIIKSKDSEEWNYYYKIKNSKPIEEKNIKFSYKELGNEVKLAKKNGIFTDYETGEKNQKEKEIRSTSLPSYIEINSENNDNFFLQGYYTERNTIEHYKTIYANYNLPHAYIEPNGPIINEDGQTLDYVPKDQPLRFLVYNFDYGNKTRREYVRDADDTGVISEVNSYEGESYNFGHYRFYDNSESLDINDSGYTGLYENFHKDVLFWESELKRNVQLIVQIPDFQLNDFNFLKKIKIGEDKFLFKDISLKLTINRISVEQINAYTVP